MKSLFSLGEIFRRGRFAVVGAIVLVNLSALASHCMGKDGFTASLSAERLVELGLDHLTIAQRAAVDAAVQAYANGTVVEARREETLRRIGRTDRPPATELRLQSRIAGPFIGWSGNTVFLLENGQVWQQVGADEYYHRFPEGVEVAIIPGAIGSFRLVLSTGASVPVRRRR